MHCIIAASREMSDEPLFFSLAFSCFVSIIAIIRSLRERTVAAWIDGKSFCFLFGASILYLWLWNFRPEIIRETYACMLLFILCTSVSNESLDTKHLTQAILGSSILFSLYGLAQRCGFFASPTAYFPMTGSFDNPAGLGMFLAISFPYALSQYQYGWTNRLIVFLIGLTLLLTESRTSILAAAVAATIYFPTNYPPDGNGHCFYLSVYYSLAYTSTSLYPQMDGCSSRISLHDSFTDTS